MLKLIKSAVKVYVNEKQVELFNALVCSILTMQQEDIILYPGVHDLAEIADMFADSMIAISKEELSELTPLDYADLYSTIIGGNTILFLKNYQNYIGPIE